MGDQKCIIFCLQTRSLREGEGEEGEAKQRYGYMPFVWNYMDFGMIIVHKLLGYGLLGFSLEINLVPFSRVLLGIHPNSRFKGSLVEKP